MDTPALLAFLLVTLLGLPAAHAQATTATDYLALTTGLGASVTLPSGIGYPGGLVLQGNMAVILPSSNPGVPYMAAGRVADGRVVAFAKESFVSGCSTAVWCSSPMGRLLINSINWGAGLPGSAIRVAVDPSMHSTSFRTNLDAAAAAAGVAISFPVNATSYALAPTGLRSGASAAAHVFLTTSNKEYTDAEIDAIQAFVSGGGALILGGQAWYASYTPSYNIYQSFPGNRALGNALGNPVTWTDDSVGQPSTIAIPSTQPSTLLAAGYAAAAFQAHVNGTAPLTLSELNTAVASLNVALKRIPLGNLSIWPALQSSLALLESQGKGLRCGSIDASDPIQAFMATFYLKLHQGTSGGATPEIPCSAVFPGKPSAPGTETIAVTVNASYPDTTLPLPWGVGHAWVSTGIWAPAGSPITITLTAAPGGSFPAAGVTAGSTTLGVQMGSHTDDISRKSSWCRMPYSMVKRAFFGRDGFTTGDTSATLVTSTGTGGLIYLLVARGNTFGPVTVTVQGGVRAPYYEHGVTDPAVWLSTIRNYPAPWAEFSSSKFAFTMSSQYLSLVSDPAALMNMWDAVINSMSDLSGIPRDRPRSERFVFDCDISAGWMHSGYPAMGYNSATPSILSRDGTDKWGFIHEMGHNHQLGSYTFSNQGEVTVNIFSTYAAEVALNTSRTMAWSSNLTPRNRQARLNTYFAPSSTATPFTWDAGTGLDMYLQISEHVAGVWNTSGGWDFYKALLARYLVIEKTAYPSTEDAKIQTWVLESSKLSGLNMVPYYQAWRFAVSAETVNAVAALNLPATFPVNPALVVCRPGECGQSCDIAPVGPYAPGGSFAAPQPACVACANGKSTIARNSTSADDCKQVCDGVVIRLKSLASNTNLNLAEVVLFDANGVQIPRSQLVFNMSTTYSSQYVAENCNDGDTTNMCHTNSGTSDPSPYLTITRVCTDGVPIVKKVVVYNRSSCCQSRIKSFKLDYYAVPSAAWWPAPITAEPNFTYLFTTTSPTYTVMIP